MDITTSEKTRLAIIVSLAARLTDPRSKMEYFSGLFRFADQKCKVEDALKSRMQALSNALFKKMEPSSVLSPGGRGGRGRGNAGILSPAGRGRGGRGSSSTTSSSHSGTSHSTSSNIATSSRIIDKSNVSSRPDDPISLMSSLTLDSRQGESSPSAATKPRPSLVVFDSPARPKDSDDDSDEDNEGEPMQSFTPFGGSAATTPEKSGMA